MLPTALCNQIRGLLAEYGIALTQGVSVLRKRLPELLEDAENGLSDFFRPLLADCYQQLQEIDLHIDFYTQVLKQHAKQNEAIRRLQKIPGLGPVVASVFFAPSSATGRRTKQAGTYRLPSAWCRNSTAQAGRRYCWGSASAATAICEVFWSTVPVPW